MVTDKQLNHIVETAISRKNLDPVTADKLRTWAGRWADDFRTKREYSVASVTTMTNNAAAFYASGK